MATIYLIPCVKEKLGHAAPACEMYTSNFFQSTLEYARKRQPDAIYILSGRYGLLTLDKVIEPYDVNLHHVSDEELLEWSRKVLHQLSIVSNPKADRYFIMVDEIYRKYLLPELDHYEIVSIDPTA